MKVLDHMIHLSIVVVGLVAKQRLNDVFSSSHSVTIELMSNFEG